MKDKPIKQPWLRSDRVTVRVLGVIIAASALINIIAITQWYDAHEKWNNLNTLYLPPIEEPSDLHEMDFESPALTPDDPPPGEYEKVHEYEDIDMPDIEEFKQNPPDYEVFELFR